MIHLNALSELAVELIQLLLLEKLLAPSSDTIPCDSMGTQQDQKLQIQVRIGKLLGIGLDWETRKGI